MRPRCAQGRLHWRGPWWAACSRKCFTKGRLEKVGQPRQDQASGWAPIPAPPKITAVRCRGRQQPVTWRYTQQSPRMIGQPGIHDSAWKEGQKRFRHAGHTRGGLGTVWNTREIWLRREIEISATNCRIFKLAGITMRIKIYINGELALKLSGHVSGYDAFPLTPAGKPALKRVRTSSPPRRQTGADNTLIWGWWTWNGVKSAPREGHAAYKFL